MAYTPKQQNWRWYQDDAAEPTTALAAENTTPSLADNTSKIRLRCTIAETGNSVGSNKAIDIAFSTDDTNFTTITGSTIWLWADGQATDGNITTTFKTSDATTHGNYHETGGGTETWAALAVRELDFCLVPNGVAAGTTYYFRVLQNSAVIPLNTGKSHPSLITAATSAARIRRRGSRIIELEPFAGNVVRARPFAGPVVRAAVRILRRICRLIESGPYAEHVIRQKPRDGNVIVSPGLGLPRRRKPPPPNETSRLTAWHPKIVWRLKPITVNFDPTEFLDLLLRAIGNETIVLANRDTLHVTLADDAIIRLTLSHVRFCDVNLSFENQIDLTLED